MGMESFLSTGVLRSEFSLAMGKIYANRRMANRMRERMKYMFSGTRRWATWAKKKIEGEWKGKGSGREVEGKASVLTAAKSNF